MSKSYLRYLLEEFNSNLNKNDPISPIEMIKQCGELEKNLVDRSVSDPHSFPKPPARVFPTSPYLFEYYFLTFGKRDHVNSVYHKLKTIPLEERKLEKNEEAELEHLYSSPFCHWLSDALAHIGGQKKMSIERTPLSLVFGFRGLSNSGLDVGHLLGVTLSARVHFEKKNELFRKQSDAIQEMIDSTEEFVVWFDNFNRTKPNLGAKISESAKPKQKKRYRETESNLRILQFEGNNRAPDQEGADDIDAELEQHRPGMIKMDYTVVGLANKPIPLSPPILLTFKDPKELTIPSFPRSLFEPALISQVYDKVRKAFSTESGNIAENDNYLYFRKSHIQKADVQFTLPRHITLTPVESHEDNKHVDQKAGAWSSSSHTSDSATRLPSTTLQFSKASRPNRVNAINENENDTKEASEEKKSPTMDEMLMEACKPTGFRHFTPVQVLPHNVGSTDGLYKSLAFTFHLLRQPPFDQNYSTSLFETHNFFSQGNQLRQSAKSAKFIRRYIVLKVDVNIYYRLLKLVYAVNCQVSPYSDMKLCLCPIFGLWHIYKMGLELVWRKHWTSVFGPAYHALFPDVSCIRKPKMLTAEVIFTYMRFVWIEVSPMLRAAISAAQNSVFLSKCRYSHRVNNNLMHLILLFELFIPVVLDYGFLINGGSRVVANDSDNDSTGHNFDLIHEHLHKVLHIFSLLDIKQPYVKSLIMFLSHLQHLKANDHPAFRLLQQSPGMFHEEDGELSLAMLARSSEHLNDLTKVEVVSKNYILLRPLVEMHKKLRVFFSQSHEPAGHSSNSRKLDPTTCKEVKILREHFKKVILDSAAASLTVYLPGHLKIPPNSDKVPAFSLPIYTLPDFSQTLKKEIIALAELTHSFSGNMAPSAFFQFMSHAKRPLTENKDNIAHLRAKSKEFVDDIVKRLNGSLTTDQSDGTETSQSVLDETYEPSEAESEADMSFSIRHSDFSSSVIHDIDVSPILPHRSTNFRHRTLSSSTLRDNSTLHGLQSSSSTIEVESYCIVRVNEDQWEKNKPIWIAQVKGFTDRTLKVKWWDCSHWYSEWFQFEESITLSSIPRGSVLWWARDREKVFDNAGNLTRGLIELVKSEYKSIVFDEPPRAAPNLDPGVLLSRGISQNQARNATSWLEYKEEGEKGIFQVMLCVENVVSLWEKYEV